MNSIMMRPDKMLLPLTLLLLLMFLPACAVTTPAPTHTPTSTPTPTAPATPSITITSPRNGSTIPSGAIAVSVQVSNFNVVDKLGKPNVAGEGHFHYFLDVDAPTTPGQPAFTQPGTYAATVAIVYSWTNITEGPHTLSVELVNNDHTPLDPPVVARVSVLAAAPLTPTFTPTPTSLTYSLTAVNSAFNTGTITVPAGAVVTFYFTNGDEGIQHNFAVYTDSSATDNVFRGPAITGLSSTTFTFFAPTTPGTYFFRCDLHPTTMYGSLIVK